MWHHDLRQAIRRLLATPGFTLAALLVLALGIGANTALFTVVDAVALRPLPFEESERIVFLPRIDEREADVSIPDVLDLRAASETLAAVGLFQPGWSLDLVGDGEPRRLLATLVDAGFLEVLAVEPLLGRDLGEADFRSGADRVALLSHSFWQGELGGRSDVIGRILLLSDRPTTVVGVVPDRLDLFQEGADLWLPIAAEQPWALDSRGTNNLELIARLAPGVTVERASAEVTALTRGLAAEYPRTNQGKVLEAVRLRDFVAGPYRPALFVLLGAVGLVLLLACVNLTGLLLVRATRRDREIAVRLALGAPRGAAGRSLLLEASLLALIGGLLGSAVSGLGSRMLLAAAPIDLPRADSVAVDLRVLAFALALSLLTALLAGLAPTLHAARRAPAAALGRSATGTGRGRQRLLDGLVVTELALALLLLVASGLLTQSFLELRRQEPGFRAERALGANLVLPESRYGDPTRQREAFAAMVQRLEESPGVEAAGFVIGAPLADFGAIGHTVLLGDRPEPEPGNRIGARVRPVAGRYFEALGIPLERGRPFADRDDADAPPVAIVNRQFADLHWPGGDPVGQRLAFSIGDAPPVWREVVGVVGDVKTNDLDLADSPAVYFPHAQREVDWLRFGTLVARTASDPAGFAPTLRAAVWSVDPALPVDQVFLFEERIDRALADDRFQSSLLALFAIVALLMALQGTYAVLAYAVAQRRDELGLRKALGATSGDLFVAVLRRTLALAAAGLAVGGLFSLASLRLLRGLLFEVGPGDLRVWTASLAILVTASLLACLLPARRAARVDPAVALREQ